MPVECKGYVVNAEGNGWREKGDGTAALGSAAATHAERTAFGKLPSSVCYLLVQNAYPCHGCHDYFKLLSRSGNSIIIKVTANEGAYSADHGFGLKGSIPCIIYYHGGTATYVTISHTIAGTAGPHAGFPAHPSIDAV